MSPTNETPEVPEHAPKATDAAAAAPDETPAAPKAAVEADPAAKTTPDEPLTAEQKDEKELRKYVKRGGVGPDGKKIKPDFRKNLNPDEIAHAKVIMKRLGRKQPEWDENLLPV